MYALSRSAMEGKTVPVHVRCVPSFTLKLLRKVHRRSALEARSTPLCRGPQVLRSFPGASSMPSDANPLDASIVNGGSLPPH